MSVKHYCAVDGCMKLIALKDKFCDNHSQHHKKRSHDVARASQSAIYHSVRWRRTSRLFREAHPLCRMCLIERTKDSSKPVILASSVDHVIPLRVLIAKTDTGLSDEGKELYKIAQKNKLTPFDWSNLQSLCSYHHAIKTSNEQTFYK